MVLRKLRLSNGGVLKAGERRGGLRSDHFKAAEEQTAFILQKKSSFGKEDCLFSPCYPAWYLSLHKVTSQHLLPSCPLALCIQKDNKMAIYFSVSAYW